ncbi:MAG: hypothetical protein LPJ89_03425 [Hymenobacteraceae bacterium]|nr:hypothetical protein [Hymenobacteraceae bacterium]MDX5396128.1 hypothetical protein [Hymenobacteraceae bacterium]MDX5442814.1 hypothetical protein [Hymenobacteraceae bacterium]MDX5512189.1 hypothetical protein [Hymenobacteraceae bacterium]
MKRLFLALPALALALALSSCEGDKNTGDSNLEADSDIVETGPVVVEEAEPATTTTDTGMQRTNTTDTTRTNTR